MTNNESVRHNAAGISSRSERGGLAAAGLAMQNKTPTRFESRDVCRSVVGSAHLRRSIARRETEFFQKEGIGTDQRNVIAWSERREYLKLAAEYGRYIEPKGGDQEAKSNVSVGVTLINGITSPRDRTRAAETSRSKPVLDNEAVGRRDPSHNQGEKQVSHSPWTTQSLVPEEESDKENQGNSRTHPNEHQQWDPRPRTDTKPECSRSIIRSATLPADQALQRGGLEYRPPSVRPLLAARQLRQILRNPSL
jgi:hypothetical protein